METKDDTHNETVKHLEILNKQVSELLKVQRKAISDYDFINASELSELLGESIKTVYARVHQRQIPFYKPGGKVLLFKLDEIKEWIESGRHSSIDEIRQKV